MLAVVMVAVAVASLVMLRGMVWLERTGDSFSWVTWYSLIGVLLVSSTVLFVWWPV